MRHYLLIMTKRYVTQVSRFRKFFKTKPVLKKENLVGVFEFDCPKQVNDKWAEMANTPEARLEWYLNLISKTPMKWVLQQSAS
jgi:hypothetical protein